MRRQDLINSLVIPLDKVINLIKVSPPSFQNLPGKDWDGLRKFLLQLTEPTRITDFVFRANWHPQQEKFWNQISEIFKVEKIEQPWSETLPVQKNFHWYKTRVYALYLVTHTNGRGEIDTYSLRINGAELDRLEK